MTDEERALLLLPARRPASVLGALAELARRVRRGEDAAVPETTLFLRSGRALRGRLLDLAEDQGEVAAVFRGDAGAVFYAELPAIEGLVVHDAAEAAPVLSFGALDAAPGTPTPTRADLDARATALAEEVGEAIGRPVEVEIGWDGIPEGRDPLLSLGHVLTDARAALDQIAGDPAGRALLAARVARLRFEHGDTPSVLLDDGLLRLVASLTAAGRGRLDHVSLVVALGAEL